MNRPTSTPTKHTPAQIRAAQLVMSTSRRVTAARNAFQKATNAHETARERYIALSDDPASARQALEMVCGQ